MPRHSKLSASILRRLTALVLLGVCIGFSTPASAYCAARSCDPDAVNGDDCEIDPGTQCSIDGVALRRTDGCIDIAVRKGAGRSVPGLTDEELEDTILEAFAEWTSLDCDGEPPSIEVRSLGIVETNGPFACTIMPALNLDLWTLSDDISPSQVVTPSTGTVAGVTYPSFVRDTGELIDADVTLNSLWLAVQDEALLRDHLRVVAAHEIGHLLGLAHSQLEDALMYKHYTVTADRVPTADDRQGICKLYPPRELNCEPLEETAAALSAQACNAAYQDAQAHPAEPVPADPPAAGCTVTSCGLGQGVAHPHWSLFIVALAALCRRAARALKA